jgi:3-deoxy-manno-octulosonate cytidylyltransferase (CMP-KDO synthetase)
MRILAVIPSRYGSSRFPGKPLIDLKGKTMIQRVYEGSKRSAMIDEVVVATDDVRIYNEVIRFGGKALMTSPHHQTGTDRCAEVAKEFSDFDIVINVQGDEPLVRFEQLEQLLSAFEDPSVHIATLATAKIQPSELTNPNRIKVVLNKHNQALYFSRSCIPFSQNERLKQSGYLRHIGLYAFRRNTLLEITRLEQTELEQTESLEQLRWLFHGYAVKVVETAIETPNIDAPEDVELVLDLLD